MGDLTFRRRWEVWDRLGERIGIPCIQVADPDTVEDVLAHFEVGAFKKGRLQLLHRIADGLRSRVETSGRSGLPLGASRPFSSGKQLGGRHIVEDMQVARPQLELAG